MAITDDLFWGDISTHSYPAGYALGVLETAAYRSDVALVERWAGLFEYPIAELVLTPGRVIPNFVYAGRPSSIVIAIPGTQSLAQLGNSILYSGQRENADFGPGRIHSFFLWCAEQLVPYLQAVYASLPDLNFVTFVGHSLGGAVAQLLADWTAINTGKGVSRCVSFNAPRVGDVTYAEASRYYLTDVIYNTHDIVCELPAVVNPGMSSQAIGGVGLERYQHRANLVPLQSLQNIAESWIAVSVAKVAYPVKWGLVALGKAESAASFMAGLGFVGSRAGLASWVLPLPAWWNEHKMIAALDNMDAEDWPAALPQREALKTFHKYLAQTETPPTSVNLFPFALAPVLAFAYDADPGDGDPVNLPTISPGARYETIEAAFHWIDVEDAVFPSRMISVDDSFVEALTRRAAIVPELNPLAAAGQAVADLPVRVHWLMRGQDRRTLMKLAKCFQLIRVRDQRRLDPTPAAGLSTRTPIIDDFDDELADAVDLIEARVYELLSLRLETP